MLAACLGKIDLHYSREEDSAVGVVEAFANWERGCHLQVVLVG